MLQVSSGLKTDISVENRWLEDDMSFQDGAFSRDMLNY